MLRSTRIKYIDCCNEEKETYLHYSGNTEEELKRTLHIMVMQIRATEQFLSYAIMGSFDFATVKEQNNFISFIH